MDQLLVIIGISAVYFVLYKINLAQSFKFQVHQSIAAQQFSKQVCEGKAYDFSKEKLHAILIKRFPFYIQLDERLKKRFLLRTKRFIDKKTFLINAENVFEEMLVLTSATAIQLTFGLSTYIFRHHPIICIHKEEYFAQDDLKILAGHVQGHTITLSWKHFYSGVIQHLDGKNVGLHEYAHALYIQQFFLRKNSVSKFKKKFNALESEIVTFLANNVYQSTSLFQKNAFRNKDEFFADLVEFFFEQPAILSTNYPKLFSLVSALLKQNPINKKNPLISG